MSKSSSSCCASSSRTSSCCTPNDAAADATPDTSAPVPSTDGDTTVTAATIRNLEVHPDDRGNVRETYRASWYPDLPPIKQLVRSKSRPKTLRGMHLHRRQHDIWHFVKGHALVRIFDHETLEDAYTWAGPGQTIAIPPGKSHGFYTPDGCVLLYALTEEYDGSDEHGWRWWDGVDPQIEFSDEWPRVIDNLIVSDRDINAPRLTEFSA